MNTILEAVYENGIFKPISSVPETLKEHERVRIIIETDTDEDLQAEIKQWEAGSYEDSAKQVSPDILHEMLVEGMISRIPEGIGEEDDNFEPAAIKGKPLSETILEDRN
jgi:predicted DNA-binding antitoxin AbrB/MazE fold protein